MSVVPKASNDLTLRVKQEQISLKILKRNLGEIKESLNVRLFG